jgi:hypothetical protein
MFIIAYIIGDVNVFPRKATNPEVFPAYAGKNKTVINTEWKPVMYMMRLRWYAGAGGRRGCRSFIQTGARGIAVKNFGRRSWRGVRGSGGV